MTTGKITAEQLEAMKQKVEEQEAEFFKELAETGEKEGWIPCNGKENATIVYKDDPASGIKKIKIHAIVNCHMQNLIDALLIEKNRVSWEVSVDGMKQIEDFGNNLTMYHITTRKIAFIIGRRDFIHFRRVRGPEGIEKTGPNETDARVVIDVSAEHPDYPANSKEFTRATTLFCATIFREFKDEKGNVTTSYDTITQSINGSVPSWLVNTATSSSILDWFTKLEKCALDLEKKQQKQQKK